MLRRLDIVVRAEPGRPEPDPNHPMQKVTRQIAFEPTGWTPERAAKIADLFDGMAAGWRDQMTGSRTTAFDDALRRGGPFAPGPCLELGSGVGIFTPGLREVFDEVVSVDLALEMLRNTSGDAKSRRVQGDGARLPFADGTFAAVVLVNMFLFPDEVARVLAPDGAVVWVNTHGPATPINLSPDEVQAALGDAWSGVHSEAGWGWWAVLRRS